jgi:hypothetical protein
MEWARPATRRWRDRVLFAALTEPRKRLGPYGNGPSRKMMRRAQALSFIVVFAKGLRPRARKASKPAARHPHSLPILFLFVFRHGAPRADPPRSGSDPPCTCPAVRHEAGLQQQLQPKIKRRSCAKTSIRPSPTRSWLIVVENRRPPDFNKPDLWLKTSWCSPTTAEQIRTGGQTLIATDSYGPYVVPVIDQPVPKVA